MATQSAQFEPVAWWWARNQIGRDLRELYEVPKELPPKLLALVSKLDAVESNQSPRPRTLLNLSGIMKPARSIATDQPNVCFTPRKRTLIERVGMSALGQ